MKSTWKDHGLIREVELTPLGAGRYRVRVDEAEFEVSAQATDDGRLRLGSETGAAVAEVTAAGARRFVRLGRLEFVLDRETNGARRGGATVGGGLESPMPGVVTRVLVAPGDQVTKGQPLLALEAMKMEHLIRAPRDGRIRSVAAAAGAMVAGGATLVELEPETGNSSPNSLERTAP
ncbi:MAG: biotin/lipoyl-containing protein [Candidatus Eisenbacteria bacterium]